MFFNVSLFRMSTFLNFCNYNIIEVRITLNKIRPEDPLIQGGSDPWKTSSCCGQSLAQGTINSSSGVYLDLGKNQPSVAPDVFDHFPQNIKVFIVSQNVKGKYEGARFTGNHLSPLSVNLKVKGVYGAVGIGSRQLWSTLTSCWMCHLFAGSGGFPCCRAETIEAKTLQHDANLKTFRDCMGTCRCILMSIMQKVLSISLVLMLSFVLSGCPDKKKKGSVSSKSVYGTPTTKPGIPSSIKP